MGSAGSTSVERAPRLLGRVPALDGMRAVAVMLVLLFHTGVVHLGIPNPSPLDVVRKGGFLGVDLFFVLSGFLITALLLREQAEHGRARVGAFYRRRAVRLLPALYLMLTAQFFLVAFMSFRIQGGRSAEISTLLSAVFYYANWHTAWAAHPGSAGLGHLWSLSIEEQFYLFWPLVLTLLLGIRRSATAVTVILLATIAAVVVHRSMVWNDLGWSASYYRTDTRIDGLLIGALLACLWVRGRTPVKHLAGAAWIATGVLAGCVFFARVNTSFLQGFGFTLVAVATAIIILATIDSNWAGKRVLGLAPLRAVGRVSYGIYLWHIPIFWAVARYGQSLPGPVRVAVALGLTAFFTVASWFLVEQPLLRWDRRLASRPVPPGEVAITTQPIG